MKRLQLDRRDWIIAGELVVIILLVALVWVQVLTNKQPADDNCDGLITPNESGWRCVPQFGGPLLCDPTKQDG